MHGFFQDVRQAFRLPARRPGFAAAVVLTTALGIGSVTVMFGVVHAVLLKPLPFTNPERLTALWERDPRQGEDRMQVSAGTYMDWKRTNGAFDGVAAYFSWNYNLTGIDDPQRLSATVVTDDFFDVLGVRPALGRTFTATDEATADGVPAVVLGDGLWRRSFGADPSIVGKTISLNFVKFTVVGVMAREFKFPDSKTDLWTIKRFTPEESTDRRSQYLKVVARLKPGVTVGQAQAEMNRIAGALELEHPDTNAGRAVSVVSLHDDTVRDVARAAWILFGAVGFLLLIACANVANLFLVRASERRRETALRAALGADRRHIVQRFLAESLVLFVLGGMLGTALAVWGVSIIAAVGPADVPRIEEVAVNKSVLVFTLGVTLLASTVFGLIPGIFGSRTNLREVLDKGGAWVAGTGGFTRRLFVTAQVALAVILLVGAGLFIRSFMRLRQVDPGFDANGLLTLRLWLPGSKYPDGGRQAAFFSQLVERVQTVPGVRSVGGVQDLPLLGNRMEFKFRIEDRPTNPAGGEQTAAYRTVTPGYLGAMGVPLVAGRGFTSEDGRTAPPVVLVSQAMARRYWPGENPLGRRIRFGEDDAPWCTIVGVAGDVRQSGLDTDDGPAIYQPHAQKTFDFVRWMTLAVRADSPSAAVISAVKEQIRALDKDQPVQDVATMDQLLARATARPRSLTLLLGLFAALALTLAAVGVYCVTAFTVSRQTREIGIRMALGAKSRDILAAVLKDGLATTTVGLLIGFAFAAGLSGFLESFLFGVAGHDPTTLVGVSAVLFVAVVLAGWIPARRAMKVNPVVALGNE